MDDAKSLLDRAYEAAFGALSAEDEAWLATKPTVQQKIERIPMFRAAASPVSAMHAEVIIVQLQRLLELLEKRHSAPPADERAIKLLERIAGRLDTWI